MAKLLIEIELDDSDIPDALDYYSLVCLLGDIHHRQVEVDRIVATVTNDQGEIIRESE